jgi:hypothetical protein
MSQDKDAKSPERVAIEHDVKNARDVVSAKVKAARAKANVDIAEAKRDVQQRIDEARVDAHEKR